MVRGKCSAVKPCKRKHDDAEPDQPLRHVVHVFREWAVQAQSANMGKIKDMTQELNALCDEEKNIAQTVFAE